MLAALCKALVYRCAVYDGALIHIHANAIYLKRICMIVGWSVILLLCLFLFLPIFPSNCADFVDKEKSGNNTMWVVGAMAIVRVTLRGGAYREDIGYGSSKHPSKSQGRFC